MYLNNNRSKKKRKKMLYRYKAANFNIITHKHFFFLLASAAQLKVEALATYCLGFSARYLNAVISVPFRDSGEEKEN